MNFATGIYHLPSKINALFENGKKSIGDSFDEAINEIKQVEKRKKLTDFAIGCLVACFFPLVHYGTKYLLRTYSIIPSEVLDLKEDDSLKVFQTLSPTRKLATQYFSLPLLFGGGTLVIPFLEEVLFGKMLQNQLLEKKVTLLLKDNYPNAANFWENSKWAKCIRIGLLTAIFALAHIPQYFISSHPMARNLALYHSLSLIPMGFARSYLNEQNHFFVAFGLHATNNMIGSYYRFYQVFKACS